jgi:hypothetical protein
MVALSPTTLLLEPGTPDWAQRLVLRIDERLRGVSSSGGGTTILNGSGPPAASLGADGDYYLDTTAHILYGPKGTGVGATETGFGASTTSSQSVDNSNAYSIGRDIQIKVPGQVTGLRFYRPSSATATSRNLRLWSSAGVQLGPTLATAGETGTGWIQVLFPTPVQIAAAQTVRPAFDLATGQYFAVGAPGGTPGADLTPGSYYYVVGVGLYPNTVNPSNQYWADLLFQPAVNWPVALKGAP